MSSPKVLGAVSLAATTATSVYKPAVGKSATVNVRLTNIGATARTVRLCLSTTTALQAQGYIVYEESIPANGTLEVTGLAIHEAYYILAYASGISVSVVAYGIEVG